MYGINTIKIPAGTKFRLPVMRQVNQKFKIPPAIDIQQRIDEQWKDLAGIGDRIKGRSIAVGVGSRGIRDIDLITAAIIEKLKAAGSHPFIVPAMGSHGGATAEGQRDVLAHLGITRERMDVPIRAGMETVSLGQVAGIPLYFSKLAHDADGIVLINRVKPHTDFTGPIESGILKMLVVGLGNQKGADHYHKTAVSRGFYEMIVTAGRQILEKTPFLFGVPVVENQNHEICELAISTGTKIEATEISHLELARQCLPKLPLNEIDVLIVDEMGKDISGAGLDPNVVGFSSCKWGVQNSEPNITRVFVRNISTGSEGNASGIGMVDVATRKMVESIDWQATAINAYTACCPEDCRVPMTVESEREAIRVLLNTIRPYAESDLRLVHIKNTLDLDELYLSEGCLDCLNPDVRVDMSPTPLKMSFDANLDIEYR